MWSIRRRKSDLRLLNNTRAVVVLFSCLLGISFSVDGDLPMLPYPTEKSQNSHEMYVMDYFPMQNELKMW